MLERKLLLTTADDVAVNEFTATAWEACIVEDQNIIILEYQNIILITNCDN